MAYEIMKEGGRGLFDEGCSLEFSPTGPRFLEDEPVVPGSYTAF